MSIHEIEEMPIEFESSSAKVEARREYAIQMVACAVEHFRAAEEALCDIVNTQEVDGQMEHFLRIQMIEITILRMKSHARVRYIQGLFA